jgi:hypothetical protein
MTWKFLILVLINVYVEEELHLLESGKLVFTFLLDLGFSKRDSRVEFVDYRRV